MGKQGLVGSTCRVGNCYDNSIMEGVGQRDYAIHAETMSDTASSSKIVSGCTPHSTTCYPLPSSGNRQVINLSMCPKLTSSGHTTKNVRGFFGPRRLEGLVEPNARLQHGAVHGHSNKALGRDALAAELFRGKARRPTGGRRPTVQRTAADGLTHRRWR